MCIRDRHERLLRNLEKEWAQAEEDMGDASTPRLPRYHHNSVAEAAAESRTLTTAGEQESYHVLISCIDECAEVDEEDPVEDDECLLTESTQPLVDQVLQQSYSRNGDVERPSLNRAHQQLNFASAGSGATMSD